MSSANNRVEASESAWIGAALRLRTNAAKRFKKADNAACVVWKMLTIAQSWFRRLNAPELLEEVWKGVAFDYLDGPTVRVASTDNPMPYSRELELSCLPDEAKTVSAVHGALGR